MLASFGSLSVIPWILFAQSSWNLNAVPVVTTPPTQRPIASVEILDRAGLFRPEAVQRARNALRLVHQEHRTPVRVETVRSLNGAWVADVAHRHDALVAPDHLFVLIAAREREVGVIAARHGPASHLTDQQRETIRLAFLDPLRDGEPDRALDQGARAIAHAFLPGAPGSRSNTRDAIISGSILLTCVVGLLAALAWKRLGSDRDRDRGHDQSIPRAQDQPRAPFDALLIGDSRVRALDVPDLFATRFPPPDDRRLGAARLSRQILDLCRKTSEP